VNANKWELAVAAAGEKRTTHGISTLLQMARCRALAAENCEKHRLSTDVIQQGVTTTEYGRAASLNANSMICIVDADP
jgi:hypothetical protein